MAERGSLIMEKSVSLYIVIPDKQIYSGWFRMNFVNLSDKVVLVGFSILRQREKNVYSF